MEQEEFEAAVVALRRHFQGVQGEGGFEKIRAKSPREEERDERRRQKNRHGKTPNERKGVVEMASTTQSPFGRALFLAREVQERTADTSELTRVVSSLEAQEQRKLIFRVQREVLFEATCRLPALFAVCRAAKSEDGKNAVGLAYATAAVYKAVHEGGMSLEDMLAVGLATVNTFQTKEGKTVSRVEPRISRETLQSATRQLRQRGRRAAAEILENYLLQGERRRLEAQARRAAEAQPEG